MPRVSHITALYLITGVCGLVDAACFLSMGRVFAEIMTGNMLFLCFSIGTGQSIFGDAKYGAVHVFAPGVALHARSLTFLHPVRYEPITLTAPLPGPWHERFKAVLQEAKSFGPSRPR